MFQFVRDHKIKLADSGLARLKAAHPITQSHHTNTLGTTCYLAPEVSENGQRALSSSDVWSGCLVSLQWYTGKRSWRSTGPQSIQSMKANKQMPHELSDVPEKLQIALRSGLNYDPHARPDAAYIKNNL